MQSIGAEDPLKWKIIAEGPREISFKINKAEVDLRPHKRKQIKVKEGSPEHRDNRHDFLDLRLDNEALDLIQVALENMVLKDLKPLDLAQQSQDLIIKETDDFKIEIKRSQTKWYTHEIV